MQLRNSKRTYTDENDETDPKCRIFRMIAIQLRASHDCKSRSMMTRIKTAGAVFYGILDNIDYIMSHEFCSGAASMEVNLLKVIYQKSIKIDKEAQEYASSYNSNPQHRIHQTVAELHTVLETIQKGFKTNHPYVCEL